MAPALHASAAMLARRQLLLATTSRAAAATATTTPAVAAVRIMAQRGYATPKGPPPANFRMSRRIEWTWDRDSTLDRMGKFFLLTEMARGMYVLLEQYFRPPYVAPSRCKRQRLAWRE